jgi:hypothetical protein
MTTQRRTPGRIRSLEPRSVPVPNPERVRWSRILSAQARIASGYYEREDVKDFLVEAIWKELHQN